MDWLGYLRHVLNSSDGTSREGRESNGIALGATLLKLLGASALLSLSAGFRGVVPLSGQTLVAAFLFVSLVALVVGATRLLMRMSGIGDETPAAFGFQIFCGLLAFVIGWPGFTRQMVMWSWSELLVVAVCSAAIAAVVWLADRGAIRRSTPLS